MAMMKKGSLDIPDVEVLAMGTNDHRDYIIMVESTIERTRGRGGDPYDA